MGPEHTIRGGSRGPTPAGGRRGLAGLAAAASLLVASAAAGEPAASPTVDEARRRFEAAVALADEGRFEEALGTFRELHERRPHHVLLYNISWCLSRLGRSEEALATFEAYLEGGDDSEQRLAAARQEVSRLRAPVVEAEETEPIEAPPGASAPTSPSFGPPLHLPPEPRASERHGLRAGWFWGVFGLAAITGGALAVTGGLTLHLSDRWLEVGEVQDRDLGRALRATSDALLVLLLCEAVAALVLGLLTDFDGGPRSSRPEGSRP